MGREPVELSLILGQTYDPNGDFLWLLILVNCTNHKHKQRRINLRRPSIQLKKVGNHLPHSEERHGRNKDLVGLLSLACQATTFLPPTR